MLFAASSAPANPTGPRRRSSRRRSSSRFPSGLHHPTIPLPSPAFYCERRGESRRTSTRDCFRRREAARGAGFVARGRSSFSPSLIVIRLIIIIAGNKPGANRAKERYTLADPRDVFARALFPSSLPLILPYASPLARGHECAFTTIVARLDSDIHGTVRRRRDQKALG